MKKINPGIGKIFQQLLVNNKLGALIQKMNI